jgi:hypothetical protein
MAQMESSVMVKSFNFTKNCMHGNLLVVVLFL